MWRCINFYQNDVAPENANAKGRNEPGNKLEDLIEKNNLWVDANLNDNISILPRASAD